MQGYKNKKIDLNIITKVEFTEIDVVVTQEDSMVIIDHNEIEKLYFMVQDQKLKRNN